MKYAALSRVIAAMAALSLCSGASAAVSLTVDGSGKLTGATGLNINGSIYDVTFSTGSCNTAYSGCDLSQFTFTNASDAQAAAQALLDYVFVDGSAGQFDSTPTLTAGCTFSTTCRAAVPYALGSNNFGPEVLTYVADNESTEALDQVFAGGDQVAFDATTNDAQIWTHFTLESVPGSVPEPQTWAMFLLGFAAAGIATRRQFMRRPKTA